VKAGGAVEVTRVEMSRRLAQICMALSAAVLLASCSVYAPTPRIVYVTPPPTPQIVYVTVAPTPLVVYVTPAPALTATPSPTAPATPTRAASSAIATCRVTWYYTPPAWMASLVAVLSGGRNVLTGTPIDTVPMTPCQKAKWLAGAAAGDGCSGTVCEGINDSPHGRYDRGLTESP
jgi:hypothetical protein